MHPHRRSFIRTGMLGTGAFALAPHATAKDKQVPAAVPGYGYRKPAFKEGDVLLFQGDSITDMKWGRNQKDRNHYLGHSYVYLIAARLGVDLPGAKLQFFNRGHSGNKVADLRKRWQADAIDLEPDLLSILIGVNDVGRNRPVPLEAWEADYRAILEQSRAANPDLRIVLLDPFVLPVTRLANEPAWSAWRGEVDKLCAIVTRLADDFNAVQVKTQAVFDRAAKDADPAHWIWDGVHPLPQGHELIARNWLQAVSG